MADDLARGDVTKHVRFRKRAKKDADKWGNKFFMFTGPMDTRTCPECEKHMGVVYTEEELLQINPNAFTHGLCEKCRCSLDPQRERDGVVARRWRELKKELVTRLAEFRKTQ